MKCFCSLLETVDIKIRHYYNNYNMHYLSTSMGGISLELEEQKRQDIKEGLKGGIPMVIGYIPVAMAFGILAKTEGVSLLDSMLFSVLVFAGASQFMALNLLALGVGTGEIILATLLMNFRHFLMSASLAAKLEDQRKRWIPLAAFAITDETFSVAALRQGPLTLHYLLPMEYSAYGAWVGGTAIGYLLGSALPDLVKASMGVALYAMFVAILVPEVRKSKIVTTLALGAGIVNTMLSYSRIVTSGWSLILTILLVAAVGAWIFDGKEVENNE
jgi:4-azaleucine resistance transporter AzlC